MNRSSCIANNNHILLSFKYSIKNKNYTIEKITGANQKCNKIMKKLFEKLQEISKLTWKELQNRPRESGYEMIPISQFKIDLTSIKEELKLADDSKIIVFRFNNQDVRLLGVRSQECSSILYVIGYDWDFSAYNHGS